ncbi:MAG: CPBP family intramembrane metalloprotease [Deltaproteobacteria bacterium]|nr:CPBP family intramembrane metalloprotease [Deltaproteobacteria bacterium]
MRRSIVGAIYKKELIETLRDRRTIATMLLVPMISYPLVVLLFSEAASLDRESTEAQRTIVQALAPLPPSIAGALRGDAELVFLEATATTTLSTVSPALIDSARAALRASDLALLPLPGATQALDTSSTAQFLLYYDETLPRGTLARSRVEAALDRAGISLRDARLAERGLSRSWIRPIAYQSRSITTASELGGHLASLMLPVLLLVFIALATFYPAIELTAGEKERGTLATLLTAPIQPAEIVVGKYLTVVTIGALAGLLNVSVIAATITRALLSTGEAPALALPKPTLALALGMPVAVVTVAGLVGALLLLIASFGRSFRDGANLLSPALLLITMPAALASLPSAELTRGWALVPIAGLVLWMKSLLLDRSSLEQASLVIVTSSAYAAVALALATRVFTDERARFATEGRRADLRALFLSPPEPGVLTALTFAGAVFAANFFSSALFAVLPPLFALAATQAIAHAFPAWLIARWLRPEVRLLPLDAPSARRPAIIASAIGIGAFAWLGAALPAAWLTRALLPGAGSAGQGLEQALGLADAPWPLLLLGVALVPAFAEELVFRGALFGLLRARIGAASAIVLQAILFGLLHGSAYRFLPTAVLGLLLGLLRERSGALWLPMLAHALSNGLVVLVVRFAPGVSSDLSGPSPIALAGALALAIAVAPLTGRLTTKKPPS